MSKLEKEVKILNINIVDTKIKLTKIGAEFKSLKSQKIFTYDIPTIYYRYLEAIELLKSANGLLVETALKKLQIVLDEFSDLVDEKILNEIYLEMGILNFDQLLKKDTQEVIMIFNNSKLFLKAISQKMINPNKWVRLRKSNDQVELTVKHIYEKDASNIQKVKEYEVNVSDLEEANLVLEEMGIVKRNYQEKIRHSFKYKSAEIEIDEWPQLEPYMEIECDDEKIIDEIIEKLNFREKEIISLNTEQLYKRKNIDILKISELKF